MIEELKEEKLIEKVGGRFRLSTLIQKRLVYLNRGSRAYVDNGEADSDHERKDKLQTVIREILEDKIYLDMDGNICERDGNGNELGPVDLSNME